jgi:hypothetical protein
MARKATVIIVMAIILTAQGNGASAQQNGGGARLKSAAVEEGEVFKVPLFADADAVNSYLVRARDLTVAGRDCCMGGDSWEIRAFGFLGVGSSLTTPESAPPLHSCTPPTEGYSGTLSLPSWRIGIVTVRASSAPGGFPAAMYLHFSSPEAVSVTQRLGSDSCE